MNGLFLSFFKSTKIREANPRSKQTSDPIHSDKLWQKMKSRKVQMVNLRVLLCQD